MRVEYLNTASGHAEKLWTNEAHAAQYEETLSLLSDFGLGKDEQAVILKTLAGILHLGNLKFYHDRDDETLVEVMNEPDLVESANLLGLDPEEMKHALTHRINITRDGQALGTRMMLHQVTTNRDELAQLLYASLFDRIVAAVNYSLYPVGCDANSSCFVTVIDPPGFETLEPVPVAPKQSESALKTRMRRRARGAEVGMDSGAARRWRRAAMTFRAANAAKKAVAYLHDQNVAREQYKLCENVLNEASPFAAEGRRLHQEHQHSPSPVTRRKDEERKQRELAMVKKIRAEQEEKDEASVSPVIPPTNPSEIPSESLLLTAHDLASIPPSPYTRPEEKPKPRSRSPSERLSERSFQ